MKKVSREQTAANRENVVDVASTLFRKHGFDGIGVADIMKAAGLTHGGFYGHFDSKDDLAAAAVRAPFAGRGTCGSIVHRKVVLPRFCGTTLTQVIGMIARTVALRGTRIGHRSTAAISAARRYGRFSGHDRDTSQSDTRTIHGQAT